MNIKLARYALSRRMKFRGLNISIETDKGEYRHWYDPHAKKEGKTKMVWPYGYIRRTEGVDGDHVDCYIGPNERAPSVYIVHQNKAPNFTEYDEDKCMLGFLSMEDAKKAYLKHLDDPRFLGSITKMSWEDFEKKVKKTFDRPSKIAMQKQALNLQQAIKIEGLLGKRTASEMFREISRQAGELGPQAIKSHPMSLQITPQGVMRTPLPPPIPKDAFRQQGAQQALRTLGVIK